MVPIGLHYIQILNSDQNIDTFAPHFAEGYGGLSINDIQKEVSRVVVGLAGVSWEMTVQTKLQSTSSLHWVMLYWIKVNVMFLPMSEKYSSALCAGPW